jgi:hypothetical protein
MYAATNASEILRQWTGTVKEQLLPDLHGHQAKALAAVSVGMARSGHCDSGRIAAAMPGGDATVASKRRRVERIVSNGKVHADRAQIQLARAVLSSLARCPGRPLVLILDETPQGQYLKCLKVSVGYRRRSVPLAWVCYPPDAPPLPMPKLIWRLLRRVARCLPAGVATDVTLLADRGLSWPSVLDCCVLLGWHYVLRLQGQVCVRLTGDDGTVMTQQAKDLAPRPGAPRWFGTGVDVFKGAGWRRANVVATWEPQCKDPWLLVTDLPATFRRCAGYCRRTWCEQLHRDEKSQGFNWQRSLVREPSHAARLLLAMALATVLAITTGTWVLKRGLRRILESTRRRKLSVFQLGLRWLSGGTEQPPCTLYLYPS